MTITVPLYIPYDDITEIPVVAAEDQCVRNFWSGGPKLSTYQEFGVKAVLEGLNTAIHTWPCKAEHGKQLSSNARIMELFEMLETGGKTAAIPEVIWDVERYRGIVEIGNIRRPYR
jgi:hypothetical protein